MTKSELPYLDCVFLGPVLMYVNQSKGPFISERILLNVILVSFLVSQLLMSKFLYFPFVCQTTIAISDYAFRFLPSLIMHYIVKKYVKIYVNKLAGRYLKSNR